MSANASTIKQFEERIAENNTIILDLEEQLQDVLPEETLSATMDAFYAVRYALDLELILALRNTAGYLLAAEITDTDRIKEVLISAIGDSMKRIKKYRTRELEDQLLENARSSKSKIILIKDLDIS